ncbi:hypothetical protein FGG08_003193 [Glutinoglossum americanum]|uniref:Proteasome subunit alpha type n=1 Tax=Glutinoglossum americanum TaxID=1670608 RepID=A0A9P8I886_9PEZI|nr:hypothetical protein FGG08_003193 [Glutinoglossum americanum]
MFRNNYDNDSVTFSPQGRIFQVEYAQEAVKQGSVVVGLVSKTHAVLVALKECSSYEKQLLYINGGRYQGIDDHFGIALAGLASDARVLSNFMKQQALSSKLTYGRAIPLERIVASIGDRAQTNTQHYGKRPYGVGLLIAGIDVTGPHLYEFQPSGMTQEMVACSIGARSQTARTYLERNLDEFANASKEQLVQHGLKALKNSLPQDKELTIDNTTVAVIGMGKVGKLENFKLYDGQDVSVWLDLDSEEKSEDTSAATEGAAMEIDS